jgi:hypothetical protein
MIVILPLYIASGAVAGDAFGLTEPLVTGDPAGGYAIDDNYGRRGWSPEGAPTADTVERLRIVDFVPSTVATAA